MKIQLVLITKLGEFYGEEMIVDEEKYQNIINYSKTFYQTGFEMILEDGKSFAVFSPEVISNSILKIDVLDV
jgi:hypothetical protein